MLKNKNFLTILVCFSCITGFTNFYGVIINPVLTRYKLTENQISKINSVGNILLTFGIILISMLIDKFKKYKLSFIFLNIIGLIGQVLFTVFLEYVENNLYTYIFILWCLTIISLMPIYSICLDFVCEITYPVGESFSGGFIITITQFVSIGLVRINIFILIDLNSKFLFG